MTTLSQNAPRAFEIGEKSAHPVIAADIIYEGAAVGIVETTGYARPLQAGDRFVGFAIAKADNASGAAGDITVSVIEKGRAQLSVSGAVITDVGQAIYATDDDTFVFSPVGGVFVGFVSRWVESGVVIVDFNAPRAEADDPYATWDVREAITGPKTLDAQDTGKLFWITATAVVTLPATATALSGVALVNGGPFGTVQVSASPQAADKVQGPDLAGTDNKDHINTLATAQRGDLIELELGHADGPVVARQRGTWATEA